MATPENRILRELLAADSGWVSGAKLAAQLGVSRVAVWHHLEKLRSVGFSFEGKPARGYRLSGRPEGQLIRYGRAQYHRDFCNRLSYCHSRAGQIFLPGRGLSRETG